MNGVHTEFTHERNSHLYEMVEKNADVLILRLLGEPQILYGMSSLVEPLASKEQALLIYLACQPEQRFSREHLATLLWGEIPQSRARYNLRRALWNLRRVLDEIGLSPEACLTVERSWVCISPSAPCWVDVLDFERVLQACFQDPQSPFSSTSGGGRQIRRALDLYKGDFLAEFSVLHAPNFEEWLTFERERLFLLLLRALTSLIQGFIARGERGAAIAACQRLLVLDPLQEDIHRLLMRLYWETGQRAQALRQYRTYQDLLQRELGIEPLEETHDLYQLILQQETSPASTFSSLALTSRLTPPSPAPETLLRPRLLSLLDRGLDVRLTLLSAPPGYGKTTLVAQWIETHLRNGALGGLRASVSSGETLFAWYEVNDTDNNPQAFVEGLAASVARLDPALGAIFQGEVHSTAAVQEDPQQAVMALLSALAPLAPASFVIILDDTETLTNPDSQEVLQYLLEHLPANGHLYLLTRVDPPLPLPRLRVRGQLLELRAAELQFTDEETTAFLKRAPGLNLSPAEVAELATRAEGWAAPLWLAANAFGRFAASLNDVWEGLFAYLRDEVLAPQSPEVRDVLLRSAVLDRLNPDLCRAVLGVDNPAEWLARLEQRNLFFRRVAPQTSQTGVSYVYHPLFLAFLRVELPHHLSDDQVRSLHQRAAKECERQGNLEQALHHSLQTGDESGVARLLEQIAPTYLQQGRLEPLARWLDQLEPAVRDQHPRLTLNAGRIRQAEGRVEEARLLYLRASVDLEDRQDSTAQGDCLLALAELELLRGHYAEGIELGEKAMSCWSQADVRRHMAALCAIGQLQAYRGDLPGAEGTLKRAWRLTADQAHPLLAFQALRTQAWTAYLQGTYHRAVGLNRLAEQEAGQEVPPDAVVAFRNPVPAILREWGEGEAAWEVTHRRLDGARKMKDHLALSHAYTDLGNLHLDRGRSTQAEEAFLQAIAEAESAGEDGIHRLYGEVHLVYGYFLRQHVAEAIEVAESALHRCQSHGVSQLELALAQTAVCLAHLGLTKLAGPHGHTLSVGDEFCQLLKVYRAFDQMGVRYGMFVSALLIGSACLIEAGTTGRLSQRRQARRYLTEALALAAAEGYVQTIVTARQHLQPLMLFALREGIEPRFVSHILARMGSQPLAALLEMTRASKPAVRARAATALKVIGTQEEFVDHRGHQEIVLEALEQLASDADSEVRAAAARARRHIRRLTD